jgi:geranylgeranyl pyrophosphate synthase
LVSPLRMRSDSLNGNDHLNNYSFFLPVHQGLEQVEALLRSQSDGAHPELETALGHLLDSGGKRFRPAVCLLTGQMLGGPKEKLVTLASAVELLHTATLVHDDLIDGALMRRGKATLNARWSPPATVLTGDFIFARAAKLAADTDHLPLMKIFAETLATIVNGELTQLFAAHGLTSRENYYRRIYAKTASLIEMTTQAAAMISPVNETTVDLMRQYGYNLGMAFQIVDDVLDFTGDQSEVGKPVGSDLLQGLVTLPTIYYAENHPDDSDVICLASGCYTEHERMERLVMEVRNSTGIQESLAEAQAYIEQALKSLHEMSEGEEGRSLVELARYTVTRKI